MKQKRKINDPGLSKAILDIYTKLHRKEEKNGTEKV